MVTGRTGLTAVLLASPLCAILEVEVCRAVTTHHVRLAFCDSYSNTGNVTTICKPYRDHFCCLYHQYTAPTVWVPDTTHIFALPDWLLPLNIGLHL